MENDKNTERRRGYYFETKEIEMKKTFTINFELTIDDSDGVDWFSFWEMLGRSMALFFGFDITTSSFTVSEIEKNVDLENDDSP